VTQKVGRRAKAIAEHSGRTEVNLQDIAQSLDVLSLDKDTLKSYLMNPPVSTHFSREGMDFPLRSHSQPLASTLSYNEDNIPNFLPPFPAAHTFTFTPVPLQTSRDPTTSRVLKSREKQEVEAALTRLLYSGPSVEMPGQSRSLFTETHSLEEASDFFS
jgi:hypothetical protein